MKQLSKKERLRMEKLKNKKIIFYSIIIIIPTLFIWFNSIDIDNQKVNVNLNEIPKGQIHWHPNLQIKIDGKNILIPNNIGIGPNKHYPTHTHEEGDGTIHLENMNPRNQPETMTLDYFFNLWNQTFNEKCLLDKCGEIKMFVNEKQNFEFENYIFKGDDKILIELNSNINDLSNSELMMVLHCQEMKMPGCEEFENVILSNYQIQIGCEMMPNMKVCEKFREKQIQNNSHPHENMAMASSNDLVNRSIEGLESVKETQIINLENGDKIDLSIDIIKKEIAGQEIRMFGYNGQIPGPLLHVKQGSQIFVNVTNNLDMDTTVHWHGLRLDNSQDGVPGVTMQTQSPGESFEYELDFVDEGIYWYHPHVREDYQQELGLYGNMLVDSKYHDYYNNVNREIPLILDDILIESGDITPFFDGKVTHSLMGRFGNVMLTNGDDNYELELNKGDVVRFYITNVANTRIFNFSIPGIQIKLIGADIGSYEKEEFVDSIIIAPAERYIIEAYFEKDGEFKMKNINPKNEYILGTIKISGETDNDYSNEFISLRENKYVKEDIDNFREYFYKGVNVQIDLTVDMMEMNMSSMLEGLTDEQVKEHCKIMPNMMSCEKYSDEKGEDHQGETIEWEDEMAQMNLMSNNNSMQWILKDSSNGKENMGIDLDFKIGDKVKIRLFNDPNSMHPMQHPIHFHGQRFLVLEKDGVKNENLVWKDTVLVPVGSNVDILLDVTNPGEWMAHCHIAEHLQTGMMMSFKVN